MREDIVGMLKNAIDHGGNPQKIAQSLINSGYPMKDVKEAYEYIISSNPELAAQQQRQVTQSSPQQVQISSSSIQQVPQQQSAQTKPQQMPQLQMQQPRPMQQVMPSVPQYKSPSPQIILQKPKPLPSQKVSPPSNAKIAVLVSILLLLILALISVIVFKEDILDLLSL
jgi:hypothetical protein